MFFRVLQQQRGTGQQQQRLNQPGRHRRRALSFLPGTFLGCSGKPHPALARDHSGFTGPPAGGMPLKSCVSCRFANRPTAAQEKIQN